MLTVAHRTSDEELPVHTRFLLNLTEWLASDDCNSLDDAGFVAAIGRRLHVAGLPVDRLVLHSVTLHAGFADRAIAWSPGQPVEIRDGETAFRAAFPSRLLARVLEDRTMLVIGPEDADFCEWTSSDVFVGKSLKQLVIAPLYSADGPFSVIALGSRTPRGFSTSDLDLLARFLKPLRSTIELRVLRRAEFSLLDAYVGSPTPQRLLANRTRCTELETIEAALFLCDIENVSALAGMSEANAFHLLQQRAQHLQTLIQGNGGMMIRASGTEVLAIFPTADPSSSCRMALDAAIQSRQPSALPGENGETIARSVFALHYGRVTYGSLACGNPRELTLLGADIELLTTIRDAARSLGETIAMSRLLKDMIKAEGLAGISYSTNDLRGSVEIYAARP